MSSPQSQTNFVPGAPPSSEPCEALPTESEKLAPLIMKQVEYYFSTKNLKNDKFLVQKIQADPNHWVDISVLLTFNRMKVLVPDLIIEPIADALKDSKLLQVDKDGKRVRRSSDMDRITLGDKEFKNKNEVVTALRGMLEKGGELDDVQSAILKDVLSHHDKVKDKEGNGIKAFKVGSNPKFPGTKCFIIVRQDDVEEDFSYVKCVDNMYPHAAKAAKDAKIMNTRKRKAAGVDEPPTKRGPAAAAPAASEEPSFEVGTIIVCKSLPEGSTVPSLREKFGGVPSKGGHVKFVEIAEEQPLAFIRFDSAKEASDALNVEGAGELSLLTGDDEKQYWAKISGRKQVRGQSRGRGRGRGRGKGKR
jgi:hypothetical protein